MKKEGFDLDDALDKLPGGCGESLALLIGVPIYFLGLCGVIIGMMGLWVGLVGGLILLVLATPFLIFFPGLLDAFEEKLENPKKKK